MEAVMRQIYVEDRVVVLIDVPETPICRGMVGVVCGQWSAPDEVLEIEFDCDDFGPVRVLVEMQHVEPDGSFAELAPT